MGVSDSARPWRLPALIFLLALLSYAYVTPQAVINSNGVTRLALADAIVRRHALTIDPVAHTTVDKAFFEGHYYADKAPGISFLAIPSVGLVAGLARLIGVDLDYAQGGEIVDEGRFGVFDWAAVLSVCGLLTAAGATALFWILRRLGAGAEGGAYAAVTYALGSLMFPWSTVFFGHAPAGACLVFGVAAAIKLADGMTEGRNRVTWAFGLGVALGGAVVIEFTAAPSAVLVGLFALWRLRMVPPAKLLALAPPAALGAAVFLAPLMIYNTLAFHGPFSLGYAHVQGFDEMHKGLFGIALPRPSIIWQLLVGRFRGLFVFSPALIAAPVGIAVGLWRREWRAITLLCLGVFVAYLTAISGYAYWDGGWSTGPRHLLPAVPFLILPMGLAFAKAPRWGRWLLLAVLAAGLTMALLVALTEVTVEWAERDPLFNHLIPQAMRGQLATPFRLLHLDGVWTALPLIALWAVGLSLIAAWSRREGRLEAERA